MSDPLGPGRADRSTVDRLGSDVVRLLQQRWTPSALPRLARPRTINFVIDGGGSAITVGAKGFLGVDDAFYITGVELLADVSGTISVDIAKASYANFPTFASIVSTSAPALSAAQKYSDALMTGWTRTLNPDDILKFTVNAAPAPASCTLVLVKLRIRPGS